MQKVHPSQQILKARVVAHVVGWGVPRAGGIGRPGATAGCMVSMDAPPYLYLIPCLHQRQHVQPPFQVYNYWGAMAIGDNAHYLLDVLAGATLGYLVGRTVKGHVGRDRTVARSLSPSSVVAPPPGTTIAATHIFSFWGPESLPAASDRRSRAPADRGLDPRGDAPRGRTPARDWTPAGASGPLTIELEELIRPV